MTIEKAKELARKNAAGLVKSMDLEKLYGDEVEEADHEVLVMAQRWLVSRLSIGWE